MAIFGTQAPKFQDGGNTVNLDFVNIVRDEPEINAVTHISALSGKRIFIHRGKHWVFDVVINLWRHGNPQTKYDEVKAYEGQVIDKLWRHRDGDPFKDENNNDVAFYVAEVTAFSLEDVEWRDMLTVRFKSTDYVAEDYAAGTPPQTNDITVITPG